MNWIWLVPIGIIMGLHTTVLAVADFGIPRVLPKGRHQVTLRFGEESHLSEKFDGGGALFSAQRMNQRFDKDFLLRQSPELGQLVDFIDKLYPHANASKDLDLGALTFEGDVQARYMAPQIARGITARWSLGVAIPFVNYKTTVSPRNNGHNSTPDFFKTLSQNNMELNPKIGEAEALLADGPRGVFNSITDQRMYSRIEPRNYSFLADIVVGSVYEIYRKGMLSLHALNTLTLPTGPKDDPDDLVDLNVFHKTTLKNTFYAGLAPSPYFEFGLGISYAFQFADKREARVPSSEDDLIPDENSKENLNRKLGDFYGIETAVIWTPYERIEFGLGYDYERKESDRYSGNRGLRYDLLERETSSESHVLRLKTSYSTVGSFIGGKSTIPYSLTYAFSDYVKGVNIEREKTHEVLFKFYF